MSDSSTSNDVIQRAVDALTQSPKFVELVANRAAERIVTKEAGFRLDDLIQKDHLVDRVVNKLADRFYPLMKTAVEAAIKPQVAKMINQHLGSAFSSLAHRLVSRLMDETMASLPILPVPDSSEKA